MTDNEIIKALEEYEVVCDKCACNEGDMTGKKIMLKALDLINRQKAEIEGLKAENEGYKHLDAILHTAIDKLTANIKSEVIKEFTEKLKQQAFECDVSFGFGKEHYTEAVAVFDIEKLVEEMTEGENG